jgi:TRAP-type C4-dicarboxylate transport system substrate-binding protein
MKQRTAIFLSKILAITLLSLPCVASASGEGDNKKWKFLSAHNPDNQENGDLIKTFMESVSQKSNGALELELASLPAEFSNPHPLAIGHVYRGAMEMSQVAVESLYRFCPEMDALDAPLVFRSHAHAEKVLDGAIGERLKKCLYEGSNGRMKGLAFTYSGGYRHFYSVKPIPTLADLRGHKVGERAGRLGNDLIDFLGMSIVFYPPFLKDFMQLHTNGEVEAEVAEINRVLAYRRPYSKQMQNVKHVLETQHSLYLTLLVVHGPSFNALPKDTQQMVENEAKNLAKEERLLSIRQEASGRKELAEKGVTFYSLTREDQAKLKQVSEKIHRKYNRELGGIIQKIKSVK